MILKQVRLRRTYLNSSYVVTGLSHLWKFIWIIEPFVSFLGLWSRFKKKSFKLIRKMPVIGRKVSGTCEHLPPLPHLFLVTEPSVLREGG